MKEHQLTYEEFQNWCNQRAADGCWGSSVAIICMHIISTMQNTHWWNRKKRWKEFLGDGSLEALIEMTDKKREEWQKGE